MKTLVLNQEIFSLYWKEHLQFRTPNPDVVAIFLYRAVERGEGLKDYSLNSNFSDSYDCNEFLVSRTQP